MSIKGANEENRPPENVDCLLIEIALCPVVQLCLDQPQRDHPCAEIVRSQGALSVTDFQVPEPWSGPIGTAPILFVSSNPSISRSDPPSDTDEEYPTGFQSAWPDDRIIDFFEGRFGGGPEEWIRRGLVCWRKDGEFATGKHWVRFWASAKQRASEALDRPAVPGRDYAMTEVVRCKSIREIGVANAACYCPDRYLHRTLGVAAAGLVICFGNHARDEMQRRYNLHSDQALVGPLELAGQLRYVAFLPHPNARSGNKRLAAALSRDDLAAARSFLAGASGKKWRRLAPS